MAARCCFEVDDDDDDVDFPCKIRRKKKDADDFTEETVYLEGD